MTALAKLFSTIDSAKRILADRLSNPLADIIRTVARANEDAAAFQAKQDAGGDIAMEAMLQLVTNFAPSGIILPAFAGGATKGAIRQAKELIEAGNLEEAYKTFGIYADPSTAQLLKVIPDTKAQLNYTSGKVKPHLAPGEHIAGPTLISIPMPVTSAKATLPDVLDHPLLYKYVPDLQTTRVDQTAGGRHVFAPGDAGFVAGNPSYIGLGYATRPQEIVSNLLHEAQHNIQHVYDMPRGTTQKAMQNNAAIAEIKAGLSSPKMSQVDPYGHLTAQFNETTLPSYRRKAYEGYRNVPGEAQATLVQRQYELNDYSTHPYKLLAELGLTGTQPSSAVELTPGLQQLLDYLRKQ